MRRLPVLFAIALLCLLACVACVFARPLACPPAAGLPTVEVERDYAAFTVGGGMSLPNAYVDLRRADGLSFFSTISQILVTAQWQVTPGPNAVMEVPYAAVDQIVGDLAFILFNVIDQQGPAGLPAPNPCPDGRIVRVRVKGLLRP